MQTIPDDVWRYHIFPCLFGSLDQIGSYQSERTRARNDVLRDNRNFELYEMVRYGLLNDDVADIIEDYWSILSLSKYYRNRFSKLAYFQRDIEVFPRTSASLNIDIYNQQSSTKITDQSIAVTKYTEDFFRLDSSQSASLSTSDYPTLFGDDDESKNIEKKEKTIRNANSLRMSQAWWSHVDISYKEIVDRIYFDENHSFTVMKNKRLPNCKEFAERLRGIEKTSSIRQTWFDRYFLNQVLSYKLSFNIVKLNRLCIEGKSNRKLVITENSLLDIQAIATIRFLRFYDCIFKLDATIFPPNLKILDIANCYSSPSENWVEMLIVSNLPESIEEITLRTPAILVSTDFDGNKIKFPQKLSCFTLMSDANSSLHSLLPMGPPMFLTSLTLKGVLFISILSDFRGLENLKTLELIQCSNIQKLTNLPPNIINLIVQFCPDIEIIMLTNKYMKTFICQGNPNLLKIQETHQICNINCLSITNCPRLCEFPNISFQNLIKYKIEHVSLIPQIYIENLFCWKVKVLQLVSLPITDIGSLPPEIIELELINLNSLKKLPDRFPETLKYLKISECDQIHYVDQVSVEYLQLENLKSLQFISELPKFIKNLSVQDCNELISIKNLPIELNSLSLIRMSKLKYVYISTCKLEVLKILGCRELDFDINLIPDSVRILNINFEQYFNPIITYFPSKLEYLQLDDGLSSCKMLEIRVNYFPDSLRFLILFAGMHIAVLPALPSNLRVFRVNKNQNVKFKVYDKHLGCKEHQQSDTLPQNLKYLEIGSDASIYNIGSFPSSLRILKFDGIKGFYGLPIVPRYADIQQLHN